MSIEEVMVTIRQQVAETEGKVAAAKKVIETSNDFAEIQEAKEDLADIREVMLKYRGDLAGMMASADHQLAKHEELIQAGPSQELKEQLEAASKQLNEAVAMVARLIDATSR